MKEKEKQIGAIIFYKGFNNKREVRSWINSNRNKYKLYGLYKIIKRDNDFIVPIRYKSRFESLETEYYSDKGYKIMRGYLK